MGFFILRDLRLARYEKTWHGSSLSLRMKASEQAVSRYGSAMGTWPFSPQLGLQARRATVAVAEERVQIGD